MLCLLILNQSEPSLQIISFNDYNKMSRKSKKKQIVGEWETATINKVFSYLNYHGLWNGGPTLKHNHAIHMFLKHSGIVLDRSLDLKRSLVNLYISWKYPQLGRRKKVHFKKVERAEKIKLYESYIRSKEWAQKRIEAFAYHGEFCFKCKTEKNLQVHHLTYKNIFRERMEDLMILCSDCHKKEHGIVIKPKKKKVRKLITEEDFAWKNAPLNTVFEYIQKVSGH